MCAMTQVVRAFPGALIALVPLAFVAGACTVPSLPHPLIGHTAVEITAEPVGGDGPKSLKEALGKVVVVDFWATWCLPCKQSFPDYARLAEEFKSDLVVIGVNVDEPETTDKAAILKFVAETKATFPIVWDRDRSVAAAYAGAYTLPSTFVIDRQGTVRYLHKGYGPGFVPTIAREVRHLLTEKVAPTALTAISAWKPQPMSCQRDREDIEKNRAAMLARCPDAACKAGQERASVCALCMLGSCCEMEQACAPEAFPPGSTERAEAAACRCRSLARLRGHLDVDLRCGAANDAGRAEAACVEANCAQACAPLPPSEH
jgi:thiol-disulfide isomerase/thioredoxin